ncbi:MAG TPA: ketoacyl-ACP synthase III [Firmicutes bacterium]|nr:ketoacyl-ACP synthase III [Bacillota bacterium]
MPPKVITNFDLEKMVDTSDHWIVTRTGIKQRRILEPERSNVDLSEQAAREALDRAGLKPGQLELIIVATVTPDYPLPATACLLQARLGALKAVAFDISAGCTGFLYGLTIGDQYIRSGIYRNALIVGVEILSRIIDWEDRSTCVLFGDGAGAAVLECSTSERGIVSFELGSDGRGAELLMVPGGGSTLPVSRETIEQKLHYVKMNGNEIFKFAVRVVEETTLTLLQKGGVSTEDLDFLFLHQANLRIIESARKRLKIPPERVPVNIDRYGNTSSAAIPILLQEEIAAGRLTPGSLVAMVAFGAGLTWGGVLAVW